jgi:hypothetical protein
MTDPYWGTQNIVLGLKPASDGGAPALTKRRQELPKAPPELAELLEGEH